MNNLVTWGIIAGALMPPIVAFVQQPHWPNWVRTIVMLICCIIVGIITVYAEKGTLDISALHWFETLLAIVAAAQVAYQKYWKGDGNGVAKRIENKTSPNSPAKGG